jgi:nicotinic acid phosphoribosyltransferase
MAFMGQFIGWLLGPRDRAAAAEKEDQKTNPGHYPRLNGLPIPLSILTDSYKATHPFQYPAAKKMVAYGEFRSPFEKDKNDERLVFYGIRYIIDNFVSRPWTHWDVEMAESFFATHNAGYAKFPFPKELFMKFVKENRGYFPVTIEALSEGSVIYPHVPVYQITAKEEYSRLVTFLETILTMVWYPSSVATLSRRSRQVIQDAFDETVDEENHWMVEQKLQDFGFRGCTSVEQSVLGGAAHLLNFTGTDTMSASFYVQYILNKGKPIGNSIPATEHSVMTSWKNEKEAIENMIEHFGDHVFSVVMDTYDYTNALENVLPAIYSKKLEKGGFMVLRPDSGDPTQVVLEALRAGEKVGGVDTNKKGYKVVKGFGCIQGDGINLKTIVEILQAMKQNQFAAQNCTFGMGGGLLQKVNRDSMSFATKLNFIMYEDGTERNVMKYPKTDSGKISLPGVLEVRVNESGVPTVYPKNPSTQPEQNLLKVVYDQGPVSGFEWDDFTTVRNRVNDQWKKRPLKADVISQELKDLIQKTLSEQKERNEQSLGH